MGDHHGVRFIQSNESLSTVTKPTVDVLSKADIHVIVGTSYSFVASAVFFDVLEINS